jgi:gliding motility-associated-like protein
MYVQILKPSVYKVIAVSDQGCVDSAAISYSDVAPCCNFAYPDAFTPNGDGRNDRFRVITYGNHLQYELSIYNNWGQRVYYGLDAKEGWDGRFNSRPCDGGTYFYYLNAMCFTGQKETHKGSLQLIR